MRDGNVGVGVFPQREEILIRRPAISGFAKLLPARRSPPVSPEIADQYRVLAWPSPFHDEPR
jgi:hypothetical protein